MEVNKNMRLVRVPIGSTEEDMETFVDNILEIYPNNKPKQVENMWLEYCKRGVLQFMMNLNNSMVISVMVNTQILVNNKITNKTEWQMTGEFLHNVPTVEKFLEDPYVYEEGEEDDDFGVNHLEESNYKPNHKTTKLDFNLNDVLDELAICGFDELSKEKQEYLNSKSEEDL